MVNFNPESKASHLTGGVNPSSVSKQKVEPQSLKIVVNGHPITIQENQQRLPSSPLVIKATPSGEAAERVSNFSSKYFKV